MNYNTLNNKIINQKAKVGIIGLGYVGVDLILLISKKNIVYGFDKNDKKINLLKKNNSYISYIKNSDIKNFKQKKNLTSDFKNISKCDIIVLCLPTPLQKGRVPDLSAIQSVVSKIKNYLRKGQLIVLESTSYPGTTQEEIINKIKDKFKIGKEIFVGYSPERVNPGGKAKYTSIPKIISGKTNKCLNLTNNFYSKYFRVVKMRDIESAELTKLYENIYRSVNIGLVNEMKIISNKLNINIFDVIDAAKTKPFGFNAFYPGPGLGGHCVPIDPFYLSWKVKSLGLSTRFIELAGEINNNMPKWIVENISDNLNKINKNLNKTKILLVGLSYKKNVNDLRESPSIKIFDLLKEKGAQIHLYDKYFDEREIRNIFEGSVFYKKINHKSISKYDATIIVTDHDNFEYDKILKYSKIIFDARGRFKKKNQKKIFQI